MTDEIVGDVDVFLLNMSHPQTGMETLSSTLIETEAIFMS